MSGSNYGAMQTAPVPQPMRAVRLLTSNTGPGKTAIAPELGEAYHNTLSDLALIPGALGQAVGMKNNQAMQFAARQYHQAQQDASQSSLPQSVDQINGVGSALGFAAHEGIQALPVVGALVAGGLATGGLADVAAAGGGIASAVNGGAEAAGLRGAAQDLLARVATPGAIRAAGGAAASYPLVLGANLQDQAAASGGQTNLTAAGLTAIPEAALNVAGAPGFLARGLSGVVPGAATNLLARTAVGAGKEALTQGAVGAAQQGLSDLSTSAVAPNPNLTSTQELERMALAGASNAVLGGVLGAVGGAVHGAPDQSARPGQAPGDDAQPGQPPPQPVLALPAPQPSTIHVGASGVAIPPSADIRTTNAGATPAGDKYAAQQFAAAQRTSAAEPAPPAPAPQPTLALPAPRGPDVAVDAAGNAVPSTMTAGEKYATQQRIQMQHELAARPLPPAPAPQPTLALPAPRGPDVAVDAAGNAVPATMTAGEKYAAQQRVQAQQELAARPPQPVTPQSIAANLASDGRFDGPSLVQQMRTAGMDPNSGVKPPVDGFSSRLANALSPALKAGDLDKAAQVIQGAQDELENSRIADSTLRRRQAAMMAANSSVQELRDEIARGMPQPDPEAGAPQESQPAAATPEPPAALAPVREQVSEAQGYVDAVPGKAAKDIVQQMVNAHARGDAQLSDVRKVADLAAARKYVAARQAANAFRVKDTADENAATDQAPVVQADQAAGADTQNVRANDAGVPPARDQQPAADAGTPAKGTGAEEVQRPQGDLAAEHQEGMALLKSQHADELARLEQGRQNGGITRPKVYKAMRSALQAKHRKEIADAQFKAANEVAATNKARLDAEPNESEETKSLRDISDRALSRGAVTVADHGRINGMLDKGDDESMSEARALLAGAQRRDRADRFAGQPPDAAAVRASAASLRSKTPPTKYRVGETPAHGMTRDTVAQEAAAHTAGWKGPEIQTVQAIDDLPESVRAQVHADQAHSAKGLMAPDGKMYLIADNLRDMADVRATVYHEALGHAGLWKTFGSRLDGVLGDIYRTNRDIRTAADDWMSDNPAMYHGDAARQARAVEEVLARMAERNQPAGSMGYGLRQAVTRLVSLMRSFGRQIGLVHTYSNADVARILQQAAERGSAGGDTTPPSGRQSYRAAVPTRDDVAKAAKDTKINTGYRARSLMLKSITQRQIKKIYADKLPELQSLTDFTARRSSFVGETHQHAADTLALWSGTGNIIRKGGLQQGGKDAVSSLLNKSRELQERAGKGGSLDADYQRLSPAERAAYDGTLDYYANHKASVQAAFKSMIEHSTLASSVKAKLEQDLQAHFAKIPIYVPYLRAGDHVVIARDAQTGDVHEVTQHETPAQADNRAAALRAQGFDVHQKLSRDYDARQDGVAPEFLRKLSESLDAQQRKGADAATLDAVRSIMNQLYLETMPEGVRARTMSAKGTAGYTVDQEKVLALAGRRNGFFVGALKYDPFIRHELDMMQGRADASGDRALQQVAKQERMHYAKIAESVKTPIQDFLNQLTYAYVLGGSPAFSFMHMMQTPLVSLPMMGAKHGVRATGELTKAISQSLPNGKKFMHYGQAGDFGKTPDERAMLEHLEKQGLIGSTESQQFLSNTLNRGPLSRAGQAIMHIATFMPHHTERMNRIVTALAEYRLNLADGFHKEDQAGFDRFKQDYADDFKPGGRLASMDLRQYSAMRAAELMINDSHIDYASDNAPYIFQRGGLGGGIPTKLFFQFQKYQQGMLFELAHNFHSIFDSALAKEDRFAAGRTLAGLVGTHALIAGSMGLPGYGLAVGAADLYQYFLGDHNDPWEAQTAYRNWMSREFGPQVADVLDRGILYAPVIKDYLPGDVTDRLGMGDLLAPGRLTGGAGGGLNGDQFNQYIGSQLGGAAGGVIGQMFDAAQAEHEGDSWRAVEDTLPKALRDVSKSIRYEEYGINTVSGAPVVAQNNLTGADEIAQALGFEPQVAQQAYAARDAVSTAQSELTDRKSVLLKKYTDAVTTGDDNGIDDALAQVQAFNEDRSDSTQGNYMISSDDLTKAVQQRFQEQELLAGGESLRGQDLVALGQYGAFAGADRGASQGQ